MNASIIKKKCNTPQSPCCVCHRSRMMIISNKTPSPRSSRCSRLRARSCSRPRWSARRSNSRECDTHLILALTTLPLISLAGSMQGTIPFWSTPSWTTTFPRISSPRLKRWRPIDCLSFDWLSINVDWLSIDCLFIVDWLSIDWLSMIDCLLIDCLLIYCQFILWCVVQCALCSA